jgi:hypothetical protein
MDSYRISSRSPPFDQLAELVVLGRVVQIDAEQELPTVRIEMGLSAAQGGRMWPDRQAAPQGIYVRFAEVPGRFVGDRQLAADDPGRAQARVSQAQARGAAHGKIVISPNSGRAESRLLASPELAEQVLAVVNPDAWLVRINGIQEPYCERLRHASGDLTPVQPSYFGGLRGRLRGTRNRAAAEDQGHHAKAHVLIDTGQLTGLDGDPGLLEDFSSHGVARVLVQLDDPSGQDPFPVVGTLDGEHPAVITHDCAPSAN